MRFLLLHLHNQVFSQKPLIRMYRSIAPTRLDNDLGIIYYKIVSEKQVVTETFTKGRLLFKIFFIVYKIFSFLEKLIPKIYYLVCTNFKCTTPNITNIISLGITILLKLWAVIICVIQYIAEVNKQNTETDQLTSQFQLFSFKYKFGIACFWKKEIKEEKNLLRKYIFTI